MPIVSATPAASAVYNAKQVRQVVPGQLGYIQYMDGSEQVYSAVNGVTGVSTTTGFQVPNPTDWILDTRTAPGTASGGPGTQSTAQKLQLPNTAPQGPFLVVTDAVYRAQYQGSYNPAPAGILITTGI